MTGTDPARASGTVLVVDDDLNTREALQMALEVHSIPVITAANGSEALDAVKTAKPDLVLLDLMMPVMSGAEFVSELRKDERYHDLPVVILSAWPQDAREIADVQGFLSKPAAIGAILDVVDRYRSPSHPDPAKTTLQADAR